VEHPTVQDSLSFTASRGEAVEGKIDPCCAELFICLFHRYLEDLPSSEWGDKLSRSRAVSFFTMGSLILTYAANNPEFEEQVANSREPMSMFEAVKLGIDAINAQVTDPGFIEEYENEYCEISSFPEVHQLPTAIVATFFPHMTILKAAVP
jgi:hypothetical protein